jgi:hypothetical protein
MSSTGDVLSEESVSEVEDVSEFAASLDSLLKTVFKTSRGFGRSLSGVISPRSIAAKFCFDLQSTKAVA